MPCSFFKITVDEYAAIAKEKHNYNMEQVAVILNVDILALLLMVVGS
jgi:hypothetical protein